MRMRSEDPQNPGTSTPVRTGSTTLFPHDQKNIDLFFRYIERCAAAYQHSTVAYLAIKHEAEFVLAHARVFLHTMPTRTATSHFQSHTVQAGHYYLAELNMDIRKMVNRLLAGALPIPDGDVRFPVSQGHYATQYLPFQPHALRAQRRVSALSIMGAQTETIRQPDLDWELKSAAIPFHTLHELASEYVLAPLPPVATVEFIAYEVAGIDLAKSLITGDEAVVHVILASGLAPEQFTLGYGIYPSFGVPATVRATISGADVKWTSEGGTLRGIVEIKAPNASVVNCIASYAGVAQIHWWLSDPARLQNPRRAAYEAFDEKLETLRDIVAKALRRGQEARDLEAGVSWLLWMLGFSVAQLGGTRRTQDAADLIVSTPSGHFAVVECTTGLLKAENKLPLLHERTQAVRRALDASGHSHLRVIPIIVTSKTAADIKAEVEAAERLGIAVLTREDLEKSLTDYTMVAPVPDQVYERAVQTIETAQAKYTTPTASPLSTPQF